MAVPLPMQLSGMIDDVGRFGRNAAGKSVDVVKDVGKGLDNFNPTDDVTATTKAVDQAQIYVSKLRNTGVDELEPGNLSKFADDTTSGKKINPASSDSNGEDSITLPGTEIPLKKLRLERAAMLASNAFGKYQDWRKKAAQFLAKRRKTFRSRTGLMTENPRKHNTIPNIAIKKSKSKLIELRGESAQSSLNLKPATTQGVKPIGINRVAGVFPTKSFKSLLTRFKAPNLNTDKGFVEHVQKFRQNKKVQS